MIAILVVVLLSAGFSFLCSLMEAALYAIPMSKIQSLVNQQVAGAPLLLQMRRRIDRPISAILTFNTIANTIGATILGVMAGKVFGSDSPITLFLLPLGFTLIILVFSEIIPKTLGVIYATTIAPKAAYIIQFLIVVLYPFVWMSQYVTTRIRTAGEDAPQVSEEDLIAQAKLGAEEGSILQDEARWIENVLRLNDLTAHDLMTPRTVVYTLPVDLPLSEVKAHSEHWAHSRIPLTKDRNPDEVVGLVFRRDVFDAMLGLDKENLAKITLRDLIHPIEFVPETLKANELLHRLITGRQHLFIVSNEHGGMEGIVTLEDVLEEMVGREIVDEHDVHEDMQEYARSLARKRRRLLEPQD